MVQEQGTGSSLGEEGRGTSGCCEGGGLFAFQGHGHSCTLFMRHLTLHPSLQPAGETWPSILTGEGLEFVSPVPSTPVAQC